ncbi:MAG: DMT family transporter [Ferruginibacter sp.]
MALLATNVFFAINYTAVKYLINGSFVKPFGLNLVRVGVSALMFWVLFFFRPRKVTVAKKDYVRFFCCALAGIAINQLLFVKGLSLTYPIHASLLLLITPILITVFAARILKERLNNFKIFGLLLGIAGALVLVLAKENSGDASDVLLGDLLILINAISYTIYFILVKPLMKSYDPIMVLRIVFTIGFFLILPFCFREFTEIPWQNYDGKEFTVLALIVIGGTFLAYLFNIYGIKILGASVAGAYIYSQPLFAAATAVFFLGEELNAYKIFAGLLIFAGVYLANKKVNNA